MTEEKMREGPAAIIERVLFRRLVERRLEGFTMETAWEILAALSTKQEAGEVSRSQTAEALEECRQMLVEQIEADVDFCCPKLSDGSPDESMMDEHSRPMIEATRALLAKVNAALSLPAPDGSSAAAAAPFTGRQSLPPALQDALGEIEVFLQDQHDIRDGAGGQQLPNKAMSLSIALKEALGERP